jgi:hypothetical protein
MLALGLVSVSSATTGTAAGDRQAFIVLLGSDKANEADATGYVRPASGDCVATLGAFTADSK